MHRGVRGVFDPGGGVGGGEGGRRGHECAAYVLPYALRQQL